MAKVKADLKSAQTELTKAQSDLKLAQIDLDKASTMERMTVDELRRKYAQVFGERTNGRHRQ